MDKSNEDYSILDPSSKNSKMRSHSQIGALERCDSIVKSVKSTNFPRLAGNTMTRFNGIIAHNDLEKRIVIDGAPLSSHASDNKLRRSVEEDNPDLEKERFSFYDNS